MKFNIFLKLFFAMLLSMVIVVGAMMASTQWSFRQGLAEYIHKVELERVEALLPVLAKAYRENGNWDFLHGNRRAWIGLLEQGLENDRANKGSEPSETPVTPAPPLLPETENLGFPPLPPPDSMPLIEPPPPPDGWVKPPPFRHEAGPSPHRHHHPRLLPNDPLFLGGRLRLLDADHKHVVGPPVHDNKETLRPIIVGDSTVGWLAVRPINTFTDRLAIAFIGQQQEANVLISALALGLSILASLILARVFLAPIRRLAAGVQALAAGQYDTQITASSQDELGQLARHFNLLAQTLKSNENARRQWIADIAHELRTPLAILKGEIEALQDGVRNPTPETIHSLHSEVSALTKLVGDLHELSVSDLGSMNYRRAPLDLSVVLGEVCQHFQQRFANRGVELINRVDGRLKRQVFGDPDRIFQLFSNLLENSSRYTDEGGFCEMTVEQIGQVFSVNLRDSAPGVPDEALQKLFERLYRVDQSRSRELGGSGLGLAIAKNIVEAHGGTITAYHCEYGGLWIQVILPEYLA